jgi:alpha-beta hydrolase superfamily lysophospholipase
MKLAHLALPLCLLSTACEAQMPSDPKVEMATAAPSMPVTFNAKDGVKLFGNYYAAPNPKAIILLFHQAGSNKAEYATIAPRLVAAGYSALAIDQRSGGKNFGARNQTVDTAKRSTDFLAAKADLEAALVWSADKKLPVVIWGSSYSAALVYVVAAENQDKIAAALAFSGGDYLGAGRVPNAAKAIMIPVFATAPKGEIPEMRPILESAPSPKKVFFTATTRGVHGSSTLIPSENPKGAEETWVAVLAFLQNALSQ